MLGHDIEEPATTPSRPPQEKPVDPRPAPRQRPGPSARPPPPRVLPFGGILLGGVAPELESSSPSKMMYSSPGLRGGRRPGEPRPPVEPLRPPRRCAPRRPQPQPRIAGSPLSGRPWQLSARADSLADPAPVLHSPPTALAGTMAAADQAAARRQRPRKGPRQRQRQHQKERLAAARPRPEQRLQERAQARPGSSA